MSDVAGEIAVYRRKFAALRRGQLMKPDCEIRDDVVDDLQSGPNKYLIPRESRWRSGDGAVVASRQR